MDVVVYALSKKYTDKAVRTILSESYKKVDTTQFPTLESFLASTGQEGYMYLYPDGKGNYLRYIWENNSWVDLGTTSMNAVIKDDITSQDYTWSSKKIEENLLYNVQLKYENNKIKKGTTELTFNDVVALIKNKQNIITLSDTNLTYLPQAYDEGGAVYFTNVFIDAGTPKICRAIINNQNIIKNEQIEVVTAETFQSALAKCLTEEGVN